MSNAVDLAVLEKSDRAVIKLSVSYFRGRRVVDIRLWFRPTGQGEFVPSRKGITMDVVRFMEFGEATALAVRQLSGKSCPGTED